MSRTLFSLVSIVLLSLASASYGDVVVGDFEAALDGWYADAGALTFSPVGATLNFLSLQVTTGGGWKLNAKADMKSNRTALGVKGTTITADVTAFEADFPGATWANMEIVINAQNNNDAGANNNIGWKGLGGQDIVRDGKPHKVTWAIPDDLAAAIALTDGNIWWFEFALVSNTDATAMKFYIDNIQIVDPAKKIAFISFHGADDAPGADAKTAGFTTAPDKGYTDLLTGAGYKVTRFVQSGTPDVNAINAMDLVIVSRSVASGSFQNAAATLWNTKITKPLINLNGYTIRKSRLGLSTGNTIPDTTGDVKLTATDPNHPIFAGIGLTAGIMNNPFAGVVTYPTDPTKLARGISVVTEAPDPNGKILAMISTESAATGPAGAVMIAEWQAGAKLTHDAGPVVDVLAGPRLVFLTGAREASGITSQTAGLYDLTEDGAKMLLNAVNYMLNPPLPPAANLLANGGFEDGTMTGWNIYGPATGTVVTELTGATVAEAVKEGKYSLYVDLPAKTANFWEAGLQPQGIKFEKDKKYTFSAWLKAKSGTLQINMKPELAAAPWTGYGEKMMTVTEEWKEYSVTTPVFPADTAPAGFTFHIGSAVGGFWVDGMRYYEGDYVAP